LNASEEVELARERHKAVAGRGGSVGALRHCDVDAKVDKGLEKNNICAVFIQFSRFVSPNLA
jgi:hypothetical protein